MRPALPLVLAALAGCGSPYCGENVRVGHDSEPFTPYCSGDTLNIEGSAGSYYLPLLFEFEGLDTSGGVTAVLRLTPTGQSSQDALGGLAVNDQGDGLYTANTDFPLQESTEAEVDALDGVDATFSAALTGGEVSEEVVLDVVLAAP